MYMNPRRTGGLTALPLPESAQPMVSKSGRASEAPSPFRQVRRSMRNLLTIGLRGLGFLDAAIGERITGDDLGNEASACGSHPSRSPPSSHPPRFRRSLRAGGTRHRRAVSRSGCEPARPSVAAMMAFSSLGEENRFPPGSSPAASIAPPVSS